MHSVHVVTLLVLCVMCVRMNNVTACPSDIGKKWLDGIIHNHEVTEEYERLVLCAALMALCECYTNDQTSP